MRSWKRTAFVILLISAVIFCIGTAIALAEETSQTTADLADTVDVSSDTGVDTSLAEEEPAVDITSESAPDAEQTATEYGESSDTSQEPQATDEDVSQLLEQEQAQESIANETTDQASDPEATSDQDEAGQVEEPDSGDSSNPPKITSDKDDYIPQEKAIISGSNFGSGEKVRVVITADETTTVYDETTVTNDRGSFDVIYTVDPYSDFLVTATGETSGLSATTTFTDCHFDLTKEADPPDGSTVRQGCQDITYTIHYYNNGGKEANNVSLTDQLPANTTFGEVFDNGSYDENTKIITWHWDTLAGYATGFVSFTVHVRADAPCGSQILNQAHIEGYYDQGSTYVHAWSNETTHIVDCIDLWVQKESTTTEAEPGEVIEYTITYGNNGSADCSGATITDTLPDHIASINYCSHPYTDNGDGTITWDLGIVPAQSQGQIILKLKIEEVMPCGFTDIINEVLIEATEDQCEQNFEDNSDSWTVTVEAHRDLFIEKSGPATAEPGETYTYTINYGNRATSTAAAVYVQIIDTLPSKYISIVDTDGGIYDPTTNTITWDIGPLGVGMGGTLTVTVQVDQVMPVGSTTLTNEVEIDDIELPEECELDYSDNKDKVDTVVRAYLELEIVKHGPATAVPGETYTYDLIYGNTGNTTAFAVFVRDTVPKQYVEQIIDADGGTVSDDGTNWIIIWPTEDIPAGTTGLTKTIKVKLVDDMPEGTTTITNTAVIDFEVRGVGLESEDTSDNQSSVDTVVVASKVLPYTEPQAEAQPAAVTVSQETLPYTGVDLLVYFGAGLVLIMIGFALRRSKVR